MHTYIILISLCWTYCLGFYFHPTLPILSTFHRHTQVLSNPLYRSYLWTCMTSAKSRTLLMIPLAHNQTSSSHSSLSHLLRYSLQSFYQTLRNTQIHNRFAFFHPSRLSRAMSSARDSTLQAVCLLYNCLLTPYHFYCLQYLHRYEDRKWFLLYFLFITIRDFKSQILIVLSQEPESSKLGLSVNFKE